MQDVFRHEAMSYAGTTSFARTCAPVVREGLERDERVIVLALSERLAAVRDELADDEDEVTFVETDEHGRNPSRIATMLHSFQSAGDGRHSLGVTETIYAGRTPAATLEAELSDFTLNDPSLRTWAMTVVCLFDGTALDAATVRAIAQAHAVVRGAERADSYQPSIAETMWRTPLDPPPDGAARLTVLAAGLGEMRAFVRAGAAGRGIAPARVDDLVLAANEIVTNSLRHGGGRARLALWFADGSVVCEIADRGYIDNPLIGRFAPLPSATSGRGLWLANHLCDLVQVRSSEVGTTVRLHVDR